MKIVYRLKQILSILLCFVLLSACVPTRGSNTTTNKLVTDTTTATALETTSTTVATTTVTAKPTVKTTTIAKNATMTTQPAPTTVVRTTAQLLQKDDIDLVFDYENENYDILRQTILKEFPEEKGLKDFQVTKKRNEEAQNDGTKFYVYFSRFINGCDTESYYTFAFDDNGELLSLTGYSPEYDPSKVKPPRVATEAEIEQAKKAEAAKVPENCMVWEQKVYSIYNICFDDCYLRVETIYVSEKYVTELGYLDENSPNHGKTPPHAMLSEKYTIAR